MTQEQIELLIHKTMDEFKKEFADSIDELRRESKKDFAVKLVEIVVWALLASAFMGLIGWFVYVQLHVKL